MNYEKIISVLLVLAICFSVVSTASAVNQEEFFIPSDQEIIDYALNFMNGSSSNSDLTVDEFYKLTDGVGNITGYYVDFQRCGNPAGYILLSLISGKDPIVEFAYDGPGLFGKTDNAFFSENLIEDGLGEIVFTGPGKLYCQIDEETYYSIYDHEEITLDPEVSVYSDNVDLYDGIVNWETANIKNSSVFKINLKQIFRLSFHISANGDKSCLYSDKELNSLITVG